MGFMHNNSTGKLISPLSKFNNKTSFDTTFEYKGFNTKVPLGFGFSKRINDRIDLGIEYKYNLTKKDLLDAYSFLFGQTGLLIPIQCLV